MDARKEKGWQGTEALVPHRAVNDVLRKSEGVLVLASASYQC